VEGQVAAGDIRIMGVAALRRSRLMPDLPTMAGFGLPGFEILNVIGVMAPAATPQPILARLNSEIARIMTTPDARQFLNSRGNEAAEDTSREAYAAYLRKETDRFRRIIEDTNFPKQ